MKLRHPGLLFSHQTAVFREILITATAFENEDWFALPVIPRWHLLIIGETGTGKSHLVKNSLGATLGWPVLILWSSRWVIAGGRGKETWTEIARWLSNQKGKCVIFLDEIDKVHGDDVWSRHLRTEIFQLLDRDLPSEITIEDPNCEQQPEVVWAKAQKVLRCDCFIVAAGAFQILWDNRPKNLGFGAKEFNQDAPTQRELKKILPLELLNRFSKILSIPRLVKSDYCKLITKAAATLPTEIRNIFLEMANKNLESAVQEGKGARYVEECLTDALINDARARLDEKEGKIAVLPQYGRQPGEESQPEIRVS